MEGSPPSESCPPPRAAAPPHCPCRIGRGGNGPRRSDRHGLTFGSPQRNVPRRPPRARTSCSPSSGKEPLMQHRRLRRPRLLTFVTVAALTVLAAGWVAPHWQPAFAQPDGADAAPAAGDTGGSPRPDESLIWHIIKSAGPFFGPLLLGLSMALVALVVLLALDLRLSVAIPPGFVEEFTDTVNKRKFKEAFELARGNPSFLG